jgi:hypothetical protein
MSERSFREPDAEAPAENGRLRRPCSAGDRQYRKVDLMVARAEHWAARIRGLGLDHSFTCTLGREACADPRSATHLLRVVARAV